MWRQNRSKACLVIGDNKELESTDTLHIGSRRGFLKRIAGILITIAALVGAVFFVYNFINVNAAAPVVNTIEPDNGPIAGGTTITITGRGFKGQYERVEALVFDGNSYIDTGVSPYNVYINARFEMDLTNTSTINMVFGTNGNSSQRTGYGKAAGSSGSYTAFRNSTTVTSGNAYIKANQRNDVTIDASSNHHVNGTTIGLTGTSTSAAGITLWVGGAADPASFYRGKIFAFRVYNSSVEMTHNFMPVKRVSDGEYGLVDMESGIFYGNSGSGTISGGSTVNDVFTVGATLTGALSPDNQLEVLINNRACTGLTIISDTELTCNTPSGLNLGKEDVVVRNSLNPSESTTITDGYEYALRLNSIVPKSGDPEVATEIEIDGGVFSTPPEQFESVEGIVFDGRSWIETGFDQLGDTKTVITLKYGTTETGLPTSGHMGLYGTRNSSSTESNVIWAGVNMSSMRSDYASASSGGATLTALGLTTTPREVQTVVKDNGNTIVTPGGTSTVVGSHGLTPLPLTGTSIKMLLGSLTHGSSYGTNSGTVAYSSFVGTIYSTQICKALNAIPAGTIYQQDDELCGSNRVLVRDFRPGKRTTDGTYGFYDMVTGAFFENAGFGTFTAEGSHVENDLEVPLELNVTFTYLDENENEQTGICSNPTLVTSTKVKCTMPISPLPGNGGGKVDLTVYANDVEATPGTADADDFYYGSPMVVETISPNRGPIVGGQLVTITGNNFFPDDDDNDPNTFYDPSTYDPETSWSDIEILIGGSPCEFETSGGVLTNPSHYTNTSLTCMTTANAGGISDVEVTSTYEYIDPTEGLTPVEKYYFFGGALDPITGAVTSGYLYEGDLISVSPNIGPTTGGTVVTITGTGFVTDPGVTTQVFFGNVAAAANNITVVSSTEIRVTTPRSATTGVKNVTVVQTGQTGYAASFTSNPEDGFEYEFVTGTGTLTPNQAYTTGGDTVLLTGTFDSQATAVVTLTSGTGGNQVITTLDPQDINILSDTQIEIIMPAHSAGVVLVTVNQHNTDIPIANLTYVNPLTIISIAPSRGSIDGGTVVTIVGTSFVPIGRTAANSFANLEILIGGEACVVAGAADYTNTSIKCTTSAHVQATVDVVISVDADGDPLTPFNPNHTGTLVNGYQYVLLELSLSASSVHIGDLSGTSPYGANSSSVYVQTDNLDGYTIQVRADDLNSGTTNDNWLKCPTNSSAQYRPISGQGALSDETWGWNNTTGEPSIWKPMNTANSEFAYSNSPTGPLSDGLGTDTLTVWYGAKTSAVQPPCTYSATVMFTAIANS